jgi:hypothetical protein
MTIRYIANLTFEEQIHHWENGSNEEAQLGAWLRKRQDEFKDSAGVREERQESYDEGYDAGYSDARDEFEK